MSHPYVHPFEPERFPQTARLAMLRPQADAGMRLLGWLQQQGHSICTNRDGERVWAGLTDQQLVAGWLGLDLDALQEEGEALLAEVDAEATRQVLAAAAAPLTATTVDEPPSACA